MLLNRLLAAASSILLAPAFAWSNEVPSAPALQIIVSVAEQKLALVRGTETLRKYPISTSRFGIGDRHGSYRTPLGSLRVTEKIGAGLPPGAVLKRRQPTGEILKPNAPGRDPIVSRILWLDGLESENRNAHARGIYIHGTTEEKRLGKPVSFGCVRMRSADVIELFAATPVGTSVSIIPGKLPGSPLSVLELLADAFRPPQAPKPAKL